MKINLSNTWFITILLCVSIIRGQSDLTRSELTINMGIRYFIWEEYTDNDVCVVSEDGILFSPNIVSTIFFSKEIPFYTEVRWSIFVGTVDYEGFLQDNYGNVENYISETAYLGTEVFLDFGYLIKFSESFGLAPEFGCEYNYWNRDVDNGGQYGYDEIYNLIKLNFGVFTKIMLGKNLDLIFRMLVSYPIFISETIDMGARGKNLPRDIELEPGSDIGFNLETGVNIYGISTVIYFLGERYLKSNEDRGYHQPESYRVNIGLHFGYKFSL